MVLTKESFSASTIWGLDCATATNLGVPYLKVGKFSKYSVSLLAQQSAWCLLKVRISLTQPLRLDLVS